MAAPRRHPEAVTHGLAATGRTITAAAAIMILVFGSFVLGGLRVIELFGVGLAGAVLLDAVVIRSAVVPAVMLLLGTPTGGSRVRSCAGCRTPESRRHGRRRQSRRPRLAQRHLHRARAGTHNTMTTTERKTLMTTARALAERFAQTLPPLFIASSCSSASCC